MVPCAGPVLAAVAALAATGEVTWRVVLVTTAKRKKSAAA